VSRRKEVWREKETHGVDKSYNCLYREMLNAVHSIKAKPNMCSKTPKLQVVIEQTKTKDIYS
jgi:hypothetical protein